MKILIGCPTSDRYRYCVDTWVERVKEIIEGFDGKAEYLLVDNSEKEDFYNGLVEKGISVVRGPYVQNVKERIVISRNMLRKKVIDEGYNYFFSLEQDVIPPVDALKRLLNHKQSIVAGYYSKPVEVKARDNDTGEIKDFVLELPLVWMQEDGGIRRAHPGEVVREGLIKVGAFGLGCLLIAREVLEKVVFRVEKGKAAFDDMHFCFDAKKLGYGLYLDGGLKAEHLHNPW